MAIYIPKWYFCSLNLVRDPYLSPGPLGFSLGPGSYVYLPSIHEASEYITVFMW